MIKQLEHLPQKERLLNLEKEIWGGGMIEVHKSIHCAQPRESRQNFFSHSHKIPNLEVT